MRVNRSKFIRKYLRFFQIVFGIEPKYNIILDGNFIFAALKVKIDILERLRRLLQDNDIRLFVLKSVVDELKKVGDAAKSSLGINLHKSITKYITLFFLSLPTILRVCE